MLIKIWVADIDYCLYLWQTVWQSYG